MTKHSCAVRLTGIPSVARTAWLLAVVSIAPVAIAQEQPSFESNVVVAQFEPGTMIGDGAAKTGLAAFDRAASAYDVTSIERAFAFLDYVAPKPKTARNLAALRRTYYVRYSADEDPILVAHALTAAEGVTYVEPVLINRYLGPAALPDDPLFSDQTYLRHLRLPEAWDVVKGAGIAHEGGTSPPVVIAIVDGGGDWRHEDLLANVWTNEGEIPGNGKDDDHNGFWDDVHGINLANEDYKDNDPAGLPQTPISAWHGTAVAGAASAVTDNGTGIAGAAWNAELMHVNVGCLDIETVCHGYKGILYAAATGADVINTSWAGWPGIYDLQMATQALDLATDMGALVVAAAGNSANDFGVHLLSAYPAAHPRVLSVGATAKDARTRAAFSSYGKEVNVFAPGEGIITTAPEGNYSLSVRGTSFAAPLVSGVAALVKTRFPDHSPDALREQVRLASENMDAENPGYARRLGRGFVNAERAVQAPSHPGVRVENWSWRDADGDGQIALGEEVTITATVTNHLADAQQLRIGLSAVEPYPYIDLTAAEYGIGRMAGGDSKTVILRFTVGPNAPVNQRIRLYARVSDGSFTDEADYFTFAVNRRLDIVHQALSALYVATGGDNWTHSNWDITRVPTLSELDRWRGVRIVEDWLNALILINNNLTGTLPPELGNLSELRTLSLRENAIAGPIPAELENLALLRLLRLENNALSGEIPKELGNLSELRWLILDQNNLSGPIPAELGNLSKLTVLALNYNTLSGAIPSELGNLSLLKLLFLTENNLSGPIPSELGNLSELTNLKLNYNTLSGAIPSELGNLSLLKNLNLAGNNLSGPIPSELGNLSVLRSLSLDLNTLSGAIPSELGNLSLLKNLWAYENRLSGPIPAELGNLSRLVRLELYGNLLSGPIPRELGNLSALTHLRLHGNHFSGSIPAELGNLSELRGLLLRSNSLSGPIPGELGRLSQLRRLWLNFNSLSGEIPAELGNLSQLEWLKLESNKLSGPIPKELGQLSQLRELYLDSNELSGPVPAELGQLSQLKELYLAVNELTGRLPRSLMRLTNLKQLYFYGNQDLCAPQDEAFETWLASIPYVSGPTCSGVYFASEIADQTFTRDEDIAALVLPKAVDGEAPYAYALRPALPAGLIFDDTARTISGTPTEVTAKTSYTYTATDSDNNADSLTFAIEVIEPTHAPAPEDIPAEFAVHGNYPNPFRHSTRLVFDLPWPAHVAMEVLDLTGRRVLTLPAAAFAAGHNRTIELSGTAMSSGLYLYRVHASSPEGNAVHAGHLVRIR